MLVSMVKLKKIPDTATSEMHCDVHETATGTQIRVLRYIVASIEEATVSIRTNRVQRNISSKKGKYFTYPENYQRSTKLETYEFVMLF